MRKTVVLIFSNKNWMPHVPRQLFEQKLNAPSSQMIFQLPSLFWKRTDKIETLCSKISRRDRLWSNKKILKMRLPKKPLTFDAKSGQNQKKLLGPSKAYKRVHRRASVSQSWSKPWLDYANQSPNSFCLSFYL
jgi:hypothetical protein